MRAVAGFAAATQYSLDEIKNPARADSSIRPSGSSSLHNGEVLSTAALKWASAIQFVTGGFDGTVAITKPSNCALPPPSADKAPAGLPTELTLCADEGCRICGRDYGAETDVPACAQCEYCCLLLVFCVGEFVWSVQQWACEMSQTGSQTAIDQAIEIVI